MRERPTLATQFPRLEGDGWDKEGWAEFLSVLSTRAQNILEDEGIDTIEQARRLNRRSLMWTPNCARKTTDEILAAVANFPPSAADSYADHPKSVTEIKADREHAGALWTPRDALIWMLREIDAGRENPSALIISYQRREGLAVSAHNVCACPDKHTGAGLLLHSAAMILDD